MCAGKGQFVPWDRFRGEEPNIKCLVSGLEQSPNGFSQVDDDDDRTVRIGINAQEGKQPNLQIDFLFSFSHSRGRDCFATVNIPSWKNPLTISRLNRALQEHDATRLMNDRAGSDLRIEKENKLALFANEPRRF